jgi:hypothetical protein
MWRDGAGDVQGLRLLREEQNPPVELNRRLRDAMARRLQPPSQLAAVASALLTGALGLPIALAVLPELPEAFRAIGPILWATIGAAVAFAAGAAHEALLRLR